MYYGHNTTLFNNQHGPGKSTGLERLGIDVLVVVVKGKSIAMRDNHAEREHVHV
jgi:hypothetical protein